jgi:hypothetical protein
MTSWDDDRDIVLGPEDLRLLAARSEAFIALLDELHIPADYPLTNRDMEVLAAEVRRRVPKST